MHQHHPSAAPAPLVGVRIVVLHAAGIDPLVGALENAGAHVITVRLVQVELLDAAPLRQLLSAPNRYDWVLIPNAIVVAPLATAMEATAARFDRSKLAVAGGAAMDAVEQHGWTAACVAERRQAEGLLDAMAARSDVDGTRVLCLTADGIPDALASGLRALGAVVDTVPVYRSATDPHERERLIALVRSAGFDLAIAPSTHALDTLITAVPPEQARRVPVACVGANAARAARQAGFTVKVEADNPSVSAIMRRVTAAFGANR
jgi:uroporphyrinogen-III synthase